MGYIQEIFSFALQVFQNLPPVVRVVSPNLPQVGKTEKIVE